MWTDEDGIVQIAQNCIIIVTLNGSSYNEKWLNPCIDFFRPTSPQFESTETITNSDKDLNTSEFSEIQESSYEMEETTEFEHDKINDDVNDLVFGAF